LCNNNSSTSLSNFSFVILRIFSIIIRLFVKSSQSHKTVGSIESSAYFHSLYDIQVLFLNNNEKFSNKFDKIIKNNKVAPIDIKDPIEAILFQNKNASG
jgi:hypothetical protein